MHVHKQIHHCLQLEILVYHAVTRELFVNPKHMGPYASYWSQSWNRALLCKRLCSLGDNCGGFLKDVIISKYGVSKNGWEGNWYVIKMAREDFTSFRVSNGT